ncbi:prepilin-type N-terminal cleavage/methylation domain-containing protein, partial [bacterium]|nr:prepilin-type N-terminal cleavage/methylation domain-containing protein [bacterium]
MKNRKGFTLAEILIVLVIMGVIMILTVQTYINQKTSYAISCYHFFKDLKIAVGHMGASTVKGGLNSYSCDFAEEAGSDIYSACLKNGTGGDAAQYVYDYSSNAGFCKGLAKYLGTASAISCPNDGYNTATMASPYGSIGTISENFRLMNGYLIYISAKITPDSGLPYRVVSVDFNGKKGPNKTGEDIISFVVLDNGEVLPIDVAATDTKFFQTVIKMRNVLEKGTSGNATEQRKAIKSIQHPYTIIRTNDKKPLSFKEGYCKTYGDSKSLPGYCSGYVGNGDTNFRGITAKDNICFAQQYDNDESKNIYDRISQKIGSTTVLAECEFNVIKPQVSRLIPNNPDV